MNPDNQQQFEWILRAVADLRRVQSPDGLLAFLLEYQDRVRLQERRQLYALVIEQGTHIDTRVMAILCEESIHIATLANRAPLSIEAADWLAVKLVASIRPPASETEFHIFGWRTRTFNTLIRRYRMSARGLAGQLLFNEALIGPGPLTPFSESALTRLLAFEDVPSDWIDALVGRWRDDERVVAKLSGYEPRVERAG